MPRLSPSFASLTLLLVACSGPPSSSTDAPTQSAADASPTDAAPPDAEPPLWQPIASGVDVPLRDVWGTAADDFYAVGYQGTILHWHGSSFTAETGAGGLKLEAIGGDSAGHVWTFGEDPDTQQGVIFVRGSDGTWHPDPAAPNAFDSYRDVAVVGPNDVYAVSSSIYHLVNDAWISLGDPCPTAAHSLWVSTATDPPVLYAGGQNFVAGDIEHGLPQPDGTVAWIYQDIPSSDIIDAMWGFGPDDVYAAHFSGNLHWDGVRWTSISIGAAGLFDLWGASPDDLYGVGYGGVIAHRHNGIGGVEPSGVTVKLFGVWGDGAGTVIAVGQDGVVLRRTR